MKTSADVRPTGTKLALTRQEAAEALGVSAVTIDRLTRRGLLHPSRATRRPIYSVRELERFLRETAPVEYQAPVSHLLTPRGTEDAV